MKSFIPIFSIFVCELGPLSFCIFIHIYQTQIEHRESKRDQKENRKQDVVKSTSNFSIINKEGKVKIKRTTPIKDGLFSHSKIPKVIDLEENTNSKSISDFGIPTEQINLQCLQEDDESEATTQTHNIFSKFKKRDPMQSSFVNISINSNSYKSGKRHKKHRKPILNWWKTKRVFNRNYQ